MKTSTFLFSCQTALLGLLLMTASCKKDSDVVKPAPDSSDTGAASSLACAGKNLRLTALTFDPAIDIDGDGKPDKDLLNFMPECARDNTINFEKGGKLSGSEGAKTCPSADDDNSPASYGPSTWTYDKATKVVRIVSNGDATKVTEWKVIDVSASLIKARIGTESADGSQLDLVMTWQAQ